MRPKACTSWARSVAAITCAAHEQERESAAATLGRRRAGQIGRQDMPGRAAGRRCAPTSLPAATPRRLPWPAWATRTTSQPLASALATETDPIGSRDAGRRTGMPGARGGTRGAGPPTRTCQSRAVRAIAADFAGASRCVECQPQLVVLLKDDALDVRVRAAQSLIALSQPVAGCKADEPSRLHIPNRPSSNCST